jgi:hypothetical protein
MRRKKRFKAKNAFKSFTNINFDIHINNKSPNTMFSYFGDSFKTDSI